IACVSMHGRVGRCRDILQYYKKLAIVRWRAFFFRVGVRLTIAWEHFILIEGLLFLPLTRGFLRFNFPS
ncbi:MAG: hypothetical protein KDK54_19930, partial [Leptospiraceae bacterium]|nr:hypothetical protein [Leptospiraceae bacterium]